jgi:hypothetical protein
VTSFRTEAAGAGLESRLLLSYGVPGDLLTYHNDNASTGANLAETTLTPANVNPAGLGKLFTDQVDGFVYGQPLTVSNVPIPNQGTHNVVFVTTEHDSVYAFDADSGAPLWHDSLIDPAAGITPVPSSVTLTTDIVPEVGITATPVIDGTTGTLYVVAKTQDVESDGTHYMLSLYALDITDGAVKLGGPTTIADTIFDPNANTYTYVSGPTVPGTGDNSVGGLVHMNALRENVRSGLTLSNGVIYIGVTSHGDNRPYNGWLLGFDASTLQPASVFNTAPDGAFTAIWMAGGKPVVDSNGNLYVATGNGTFDAAPNGAQSLGGGGGALGYQGIIDSAAIKFDAYKPSGNHSSTGLYVQGHTPGNSNLQPGDVFNDLTGTGIDFNGGAQATPKHTFQANLSYDGSTLTETITDPTLAPGGASLNDVSVGGTATASSNPTGANEGPAKAFDRLTSTKWLGNTDASGQAWIEYQFAGGQSIAVTQYKIASANDAPARDPKSWLLQGSNNGSTWTTVDTQTNQSFSNRLTYNVYPINNTTPYQYYRLLITANNGSTETGLGGTGLVQLSELELDAPSTGTGGVTQTGVARFTYSNVNLQQQVGGTTAYVGFTGGTGGLNSFQDVLSWTYSTGGTTVIDHSAGFASHGDLTNNGSATYSGAVAQLTTGANTQAGSLFTSNKVDIRNFSTTFTFQMLPGTNPIADGMTFTIQANPGGPDYGDSIIKLTPPASGSGSTTTTVADYFTPFNQAALSAADLDQGSGGILLLPDSVGSAQHQQLLVQAGKSGTIYLIDRNNMGQFSSTTNNIVQQLTGAIAGGGSYDTPAFDPANNEIYYLGDGDVLKAFQVANGLLSTSPVAQATTVFGFPGATPSLSANGNANGIIWVLNNSAYGIPEAPTAQPGIIYAYDASTLKELYNSNDVLGDQPGDAVKFTVPTISHGKVYVGSQGSFSAYGLLPTNAAAPGAPSHLNATPVSSSSITLSWTSTATNATLFKIERSTDGGVTFTLAAELRPNMTTYTDTGLSASTQYTYQVVATNQVGDSNHSNTANATTLVASPTLQVSDVLASQINLSWTPTARASYTVERSTDGVHFTSIASLDAATTSYSDTGLTFGPSGTTYYYQVQAFNNANISAFSNVASALLGPIISHVDHSNGFASHSDLTANGSTSFVPVGSTTVARLTDGGTGEAGTLFTNNEVGVSTFTTSFNFLLTNPNADGFTFIIQSNSPTALGPTGGGLGYGSDTVGGGGIPNSIAVKFDLFSNHGEGNNSTGLFIDGDSPTIPTTPRDTLVMIDPTVVNLHSQDLMTATLAYDGATLTETITDNVTHGTFTTQYAVNIPAIVGGLEAFVGFGGGTGGLTATQDIQTWKYDSVDTSNIHTPGGLKVASVVRSNNNTSDITIDWKANDDYNATGFTVQRSTDGTSFTTIATVSPNVDTYTDPGLGGGTYFYRVQAFNAKTTSAFSNVDSVLIGGGDNPLVLDQSGGFASHGGLTANGNAQFVPFATGAPNTVARLTDGGGTNESGTIFTTQRVDIGTFNTSFTFQLHDGTAIEGDGITFIIQGSSPTALGPGGGGLGYGPDHPGGSGGIPNSIAVKFDTFDNAGEGADSTGLYLNGASPSIPAVNLSNTGIDLHSQDVFKVTLSYDGTTLTETITDTKTQATFTTQYTVNIAAAVGGNVGYVGFGGGTGGNTAVQDILTWTYSTQDYKGGTAGASSPSPAGSSPPAASAQPAAVLPSTAAGTSPVLPSPTSPEAVDAALALYAEDSTSTRGARKPPALLF